MRHEPVRWVGLLAIAASALLGCCTRSGASTDTEKRVAGLFGLQDVSSVEAMRAGLERRIRLGSSEADVVAFLEASGIGKDALSRRYKIVEKNTIVAAVEYDPTKGPEAVRDIYKFDFVLDAGGELQRIDVRKELKGL